MTSRLFEILKKAGTAVVSDVFDTLNVPPPTLSNDLWPTTGYGFCFAGPAYTLNGISRTSSQTGDKLKLQAIDDMTEGVVAVYAGNDIKGACCFGDLLASAMKCRKVAGVVVDGGVRDLSFLRKMDLPMLVRYRTPTQAIGRWRLDSVQEPVQVRGAIQEKITIHPGDIMLADDDGALAIPKEMAEEVALKAAQWETKDQNARKDILNGMKLMEALEKYGAL